MANEGKVLWSVLASRENADKILEKIPADQLQELFPPTGVGLKIDNEMDGPFIAFYNSTTREISYYTVLEFVEAVNADFWSIRKKYNAFLAEQRKKMQKAETQPKKIDRKNRKGRGIY